MDQSKYAQGVVSFQINTEYEGTRCCVLIQDPKTREGMSWVGGFIPPRGNFEEIAKTVLTFQTGIRADLSTMRHWQTIYSRTAVNDRWLANHCISVNAGPVETWDKPECRDIKVALYATRSFARFPDFPPRKVLDYYGETGDQFAWSINDGGAIGLSIAQAEKDFARTGREPLLNIPLVNVPSPRSRLPSGVALNIVSLVIPFIYRGIDGRVVLKNCDSPYFATAGGKVEIPKTARSYNTNIIGAAIEESVEELGIPIQPESIVGTAITPFDWIMTPSEGVMPDQKLGSATVERGGVTSVINTCLRARPANPKQLEELLDKGPQAAVPKSERGKIEGIYFLPMDEYRAMLTERKMRTLDMTPLAEQELNGMATDRQHLGSVVILPEALYAAKFRRITGGRAETVTID